MNKLVVICGPTCTGKTSLAIGLCKKFGGEIVSADSRQIYRYMDIGTGKMPVEVQKSKGKEQNQSQSSKSEIKRGDGCWIVGGIYVHLYDVVEPDRKFSVARFKDAATKEIESMWRRQKIPFLVGGTGFYIAAVLGDIEFPRVPPNWKLRRELEKLSVVELFVKLKELDPERAKTIDPKNPHRLIRAVEIAMANAADAEEKPVGFKTVNPTGWARQPASSLAGEVGRGIGGAEVLKIGLTSSREAFYQRADVWADSIVNDGLLAEVKNLIDRGYKDTPPMRGIIYQSAVGHLDGKITKEEMLQRIKFDLHGYIRRQLTWFRRDKDIHWFDVAKAGFDRKIEELVESYLKNG